MNKHFALIIIGTTWLAGGVSSASADEGFFSWLSPSSGQKEIAPMTDVVYNKECGSCHFPYQPGLLPEASWRQLMDPKAMGKHFGDSAELDEATRVHILNLMVAESADKSSRKRSRKIMASLGTDVAPKRITDIPYIKGKHSGISEALIKKNDQVQSLSYCDKCHQKAADGIYDDDSVTIPGKGR